MATVQNINSAVEGLNMMEAYGVVSRSVSTLAIMVLVRIAGAEDVNVALTAEIARLEGELAATADYGYQNRIEYALKTLKGL
jgi:hypothetical protein